MVKNKLKYFMLFLITYGIASSPAYLAVFYRPVANVIDNINIFLHVPNFIGYTIVLIPSSILSYWFYKTM